MDRLAFFYLEQCSIKRDSLDIKQKKVSESYR